MSVHAGAVIAENWLGHESGCLAVLLGYVADNIFIVHNAIRHLRESRVPHVDLTLPGGAYLMMVDLRVNTYFFQLQDNFGTKVLQRVGWRNGEISFFMA
jgi:bifunctional pyridoxal-dependent enzyme with beta-cystathionase and maltose regulon repressor activities